LPQEQQVPNNGAEGNEPPPGSPHRIDLQA
jgi:hypothetical protein